MQIGVKTANVANTFITIDLFGSIYDQIAKSEDNSNVYMSKFATRSNKVSGTLIFSYKGMILLLSFFGSFSARRLLKRTVKNSDVISSDAAANT